MADGAILRAGFSGSNGRRYRSIGKELERRGTLGDKGISAENIRNWVRENPTVGRDLLNHNPRYVFFREVTDLPAEAGPIGAMGVPLTAMRSLAVDPAHIPLGSPVWVEKQGKRPFQRLMVAQDVGGAIKGPHRGDIFYGSGAQAGARAGDIRDGGAFYLLLPKAALAALLSQG